MRLLGDIGGTNARFALASGDDDLMEVRVFPVADAARFEDGLAGYLGHLDRDLRQDLKDVAIAAAGPVVDHCIRMTNADWEISALAVHTVCPGVPVHIVNDLEAVALALPVLGPADLRNLHRGSPPLEPAPLLCLNVGTGFGAAVAHYSENRWHTLPTEAGHIALALQSPEEQAILAPSTSIEGVLSGPGLANLSTSIGDSVHARQIFSRFLGRVAGDLALATGSWGGIYLCGGVLSRLEETVNLEIFLDGLHNRCGLARRLGTVPVHHIINPRPAFVGLAQL
ncbi:MAG: ROK family protein [Pseudomonadota bacterium]